MNIIELKNISKSFFSQKLYTNVNIDINNGEKIALIGNNGSGKSTFVRILLGLESPDKGEVIINEEKKIIYFDQFNKIDENKRVQELLNQPFEKVIEAQKEMEKISEEFSHENINMNKLMEKYSKAMDKFESFGGYSYLQTQSEFIETFEVKDKLNRKFNELSGGEKQYIRLAMTLFEEKDLVILDEPLSFFDKKRIEWLGKYINNSKKAFLVISHNIDFIRLFVTKIFDIDNKRITSYIGDYKNYLKSKKQMIKEEKKHNKKIELSIEELVETIRRKEKLLERCNNKRAHAIILRRMRKELAELNKDKIYISDEYKYEYLDAPENFYSIKDREIGENLIIMKNISKIYPEKLLYKEVDFILEKGKKICIVGENGSGKSTFLKILLGMESISSGEIIKDSKLRIAYIPQETKFENENIKIKDYLKEKTGLSDEFLNEAIDSLYNYEEEFRDKKIFMLSGGEKKRLEIFTTTLEEVDLLIIDEPSTYMDDYSKENIINMLNDYDKTIVLVTHDKYLMKKLDFIIYDIRDNRFRKKEGILNEKKFL